MRKSKIKFLYEGKISGFLQLGDNCINLIDRDIAKLSEYGITAATKTEISSLIAALKTFPDDVYMKGQANKARKTCRIAETNVRTAIRCIMTRVKEAFGTNSAEYRQFDTKNLCLKKDEKLKECAEVVIFNAEEYLSQLNTFGLTQAIIDDLAAKNIVFGKSILARTKAIKKRDLTAENRIRMANKIFLLIRSVFNAGKACWANDSEARYKHYIMYPNKNRKPRKKKKAE